MSLLPGRRLSDPPAQLEEQPRLADARLADEEDDLALAGAGPLEGVEELAQLALAPHEGGEPAVGLDLQPRARLARAHDLPRGHRLGLALELELAERRVSK